MKPASWLILLGSIVLFAGGLLHLLGYPYIFPPLVKAGVEARLIGALKAMWSAFAVQFVILSVALVCISRRPQGRNLILFLCLIPLINAILMYSLIGPFSDGPPGGGNQDTERQPRPRPAPCAAGHMGE